MTLVEQKQFWIALLLNVLLPGIGHIYAGKTQEGAALIIISLISLALTPIGIGVIGVIGTWLYASLTTNGVVMLFNDGIAASQKILEQQTYDEKQRLKNVVNSQSVAESFMKIYNLYSSELITELEFTARKAAIIGQLQFKTIDGDPDDILLAMAPMKKTG